MNSIKERKPEEEGRSTAHTSTAGPSLQVHDRLLFNHMNDSYYILLLVLFLVINQVDDY